MVSLHCMVGLERLMEIVLSHSLGEMETVSVQFVDRRRLKIVELGRSFSPEKITSGRDVAKGSSTHLDWGSPLAHEIRLSTR